jgi:hypothetical protein
VVTFKVGHSARPWRLRCEKRLPGCGHLDGVAEFLQPGYQAPGLLFLIVAGGV